MEKKRAKQTTTDRLRRQMPGRVLPSLAKPIWEILKSGSAASVRWVNHGPNPRFAVHDPRGDSDLNNPTTLSDDLVWDRETGLIWVRDANIIGLQNWLDANTLCRELELGNRCGWRLPTVEELSSLVDPTQPNLALPPGHPFVNVQYGAGVYAYWTSTNCENPTGAAWFVNMWRGAGPHLAGLANKSISGYAWPVRGGSGGTNWNW
jgi:hypothetical protein